MLLVAIDSMTGANYLGERLQNWLSHLVWARARIPKVFLERILPTRILPERVEQDT